MVLLWDAFWVLYSLIFTCPILKKHNFSSLRLVAIQGREPSLAWYLKPSLGLEDRFMPFSKVFTWNWMQQTRTGIELLPDSIPIFVTLSARKKCILWSLFPTVYWFLFWLCDGGIVVACTYEYLTHRYEY